MVKLTLAARRWIAALVTVSWVLCVPVSAGTTGSLAGSVVSSATGEPIAGAIVKMTSPSQVASTHTDASGRFVFLSLAPDTYVITIDHTGFGPFSASGLRL